MVQGRRRSGLGRLAILRWAPHLLIVFGVFLAETTLQLGIYEHDYVQDTLVKQTRDAEVRLSHLVQKQAQLETMVWIEVTAPSLGLVEPEPNQIEVIHARMTPEPVYGAGRLEIAGLNQPPDMPVPVVPSTGP